jgi:signal transduction histidine kinase
MTGSLRLRLLTGGLLWLGLALLAAGLFLSWQFRSHVTEDFDRALADQLARLTGALEITADGVVSLASIPVDPRFQEPYSGLYWQIHGAGEVLRSSRSLWDSELPLPADRLRPGELHRHTGPGPRGEPLVLLERVVRLEDRTEPVRLTVAQSAADLNAAIARFDRTLLTALTGLALALGAALLLQVRIGLRPLDRLRSALRRLRAGEADRVEGAFPAEIAPAVDDLNAMLARNETLIAGARRQAGDLAHALKTPLAVAIGGLSDRDESAARALADIQRIVDHHTARARAAGGRIRVGLKTDLVPRLDRLAETLRKLNASRGLSLTADRPDSLRAAVDPEDFTEMLGVLLDNACKWARSRVAVTAAAAHGRLTLRIEDDGPGIPAAERARALKPGVRLDETVAGSGLGLAIAADLAALYRGTLSLESSESLGGLAATLTLPLDAE